MPVCYASPMDLIAGDFTAILDKVTAFLDKNGGIGALRSPAGKPFVVLNDPDYLRQVLTGKHVKL